VDENDNSTNKLVIDIENKNETEYGKKDDGKTKNDDERR